MSINALLSTIILVSFIVTLVLAIGSYMAYKVRERGRAPGGRGAAAGEPVFFERVYPSRLASRSAPARTDGNDV